MPSAILLGYDPQQPSFRHRMASLIDTLSGAGWNVRPERFPSGRYGLRTWERRALWRGADVTVLHQIKLSGIEARLLARWAPKRVFDVDDAIYVRKPRRLGEAPDESYWRRRKFAATCRWVDVVVAGNEVIAGIARRTAQHSVVLPTSIDTRTYQQRIAAPTEEPTVVWIGSPENLIYLEMVRPALARLTRRFPRCKLRVICSRFPQWNDVNIEAVPWSAASEASALATADIGIMPLTDDAWSRGKCAFKLLQYMAAALPCVASPIGANKEAIIDGYNGFHATSTDEWERALSELAGSTALRASQGAAGFDHVQFRYAMHAYRAGYLELLTRLAAT